MKLNHINLAVADVAATRNFFEQFFNLKCSETKGDNLLTVLRDEAGFILILSHFEKNVVPQYPRDFHVGFIQETVEQVNEIYDRMKAAGIDVRPPKTAHGSWGFYVTAPGGFLVEVASYEHGG
jgi:lactoylglutathione lyase